MSRMLGFTGQHLNASAAAQMPKTDLMCWICARRENVKLFPGSDQTFSRHVKAKSWWRRTPHMCRCDKQAVTMATATVVWNNLGLLRFQTAAPRFSCCFVQRYKTKRNRLKSSGWNSQSELEVPAEWRSLQDAVNPEHTFLLLFGDDVRRREPADDSHRGQILFP